MRIAEILSITTERKHMDTLPMFSKSLHDTTYESFDSNVESNTEYASNGIFKKRAIIGDREIFFTANCGYNDTWDIEFSEKSLNGNRFEYKFGKTGSGNEMQVFAFVIDSVKELVSRYYPNRIEFSAATEDGSRSSLYSRLLKKIKIPKYHVEDELRLPSATHFAIERDK